MTASPHVLRAILFAIAGFTCWVVGDTFLKLAGASQAPSYEILELGSVSGLVVIFAVTSLRGKIKRLRPHQFRGLFFLGCLYLFGYVCWLTALPRMPLIDFYVIIFLAPMIITVCAALFFKEKLSWKHGLALIIGFAGVLISLNPTELLNNRSDWQGHIAAFGGTLAFTAQMLVLRMLTRRETRECTAFYPRTVAIVACALATLYWGYQPMTLHSVVCALLSGAVGGAGWLCMAEAYKSAPATTVAPFHYSQIISSAVIGYLVWHDVPSLKLLIGAVLIVGSGYYIVTHARKSAKLLKDETHT